MKSQKGEAAILLIVVILILSVGGCMYTWPKYNVYAQEMEGAAQLAKAESTRRVRTLEATARKDAASDEAEADVIRANGIADANAIIANGLGGPEGYLRYLSIEAMRELANSPNVTVIYVPTEAGIPITEASRFNKPNPIPAQSISE